MPYEESVDEEKNDKSVGRRGVLEEFDNNENKGRNKNKAINGYQGTEKENPRGQ